ncbi:MAG: hypothetical protein A4E39_01011 [Methanoregulaceae archaeon PtaB.Bin152]|nr:MAG: hypothetical protein A4E39_01011 [Methanoregulaceae archaeon PtaB.Bin152]
MVRQFKPQPHASVPPGFTTFTATPLVTSRSQEIYAAVFSISRFFRYSITNQLFPKTG